jgi:aminoglycoside phosphotransferase (APT) family kinase protein
VDGVDLVALRSWMDARGLGSGPLETATRLSGGTQNILVSFTRAGRDYVLRRPPLHLRESSNETMRREARVLGALAGTGVPHPGLIDACADETILGAAFTLMEKIDGFNATTGLPALHASSPDCRHAMGIALVDGIAALGALEYRALGLDGFGKPEAFLARQVSRWRAQLASYDALAGWPGAEQIPGVARVAAWLEANRPEAFEPGLMHGDYHLANVLFRHDGPALAAIVDWELATIGDPLVDLGWLLATWPEGEPADTDTVLVRPWTGFPSAAELVARYRARSPRDVSAIGWYAVLACFKLGIILEGTHARACAGQAPRETGDALHGKTVALFERALRWIG